MFTLRRHSICHLVNSLKVNCSDMEYVESLKWIDFSVL